MIVPFESRHIKEAAEIERLVFSQPWSEKALEESLLSPFSHFAVFEEEGVSGYIGLYAVSGEGSITNVVTHPKKRGRGIGSALVSYAVEKGRELSLEYITLEVRESNAAAIALYEKYGFERVGMRRGFYSEPREDAVIMNYFYKDEKN